MSWLDNDGLSYFWGQVKEYTEAKTASVTVSPFIGFIPKTTTFSDDGNIMTQTDAVGNRMVTTVTDVRVTEVYTPKTGSAITRATVFNSDGSITETIT